MKVLKFIREYLKNETRYQSGFQKLVGMTDRTQKFYLVVYHLVARTVVEVHRSIRRAFEELVY